MRFYNYSNVVLQGPSSSGKSEFVKKVIEQREHMFFTLPTRIIYVYSNYQSIFDDLRSTISDITFTRNIPGEPDLIRLTQGHQHTLLILDDKIEQAGDSQHVASLFVRNSHHLKIITFLILQSSNLSGRKFATDIIRNAHYTILFKAGQMAYLIRSLGARINDYGNLMKAYTLATGEKNFSYLSVCTHPRSAHMERYSTNILHS